MTTEEPEWHEQTGVDAPKKARKSRREKHVQGEMRRDEDGVMRGHLSCICGAVTHFEAVRESSGYRLHGLAAAKTL